jgi:hypothetical protein
MPGENMPVTYISYIIRQYTATQTFIHTNIICRRYILFSGYTQSHDFLLLVIPTNVCKVGLQSQPVVLAEAVDLTDFR